MLPILAMMLLTSCTENYSNGERIGLMTKFSDRGLVWKSWEGHLNLTQTGMNSSVPFDFSIDNDNEPNALVATIDSAAREGWKVRLVYHEVAGYNWFNNRGDTDYFVTECEVIDKTPMQSIFGGNATQVTEPSTAAPRTAKNTIYVVIVPRELVIEPDSLFIE